MSFIDHEHHHNQEIDTDPYELSDQYITPREHINRQDHHHNHQHHTLSTEEYTPRGGEVTTDDHTTETAETDGSGHERQTWGTHISFLLASIGAAIGFGNFFRFPYLCYSNGGGAFLIPYIIALVTMGIPLLLMELSMGQIMRKGPVAALRAINRRSGGVGIAAVLFGSFFICAYYTVLLAWVVVYFFYTFRMQLPWAANAEAFFFQTVLKRSDGLLTVKNTPVISWPVLLSLLLVWIIIYFCVWKGVKSTGFVSYFTVPLPFVLLAIILIRSLFLPGARTGIYYYLAPDFSLLLQPRIWLNAAGQIFFTLGIGSGVMTSFGSFNKPHQDMVRDNLIVCITNCSFSFFAGFAVFSILGYMAQAKGVTVDQVSASGIGLAFIVFPEAVSLMPGPHFFAVLLFITMFTLGVDSAFALIEAANSVLHDRFPHVNLSWIALATCTAGFFAGIPFCFTNGFYLLDAVDHYLSDFCLPMIAISECLVIGWGCAPKSFKDTISEKILAAHVTINGTNTIYRPEAISKRTKLWIFVKTFMTHSVDEWRAKISATTRLGPGVLWSFAVKFSIPIFLSILWLIQFVNEIVSPYTTSPESNKRDYGSLFLALTIPISCVLVIIIPAIFPDLDISSCLRRKRGLTESFSGIHVGSPINERS